MISRAGLSKTYYFTHFLHIYVSPAPFLGEKSLFELLVIFYFCFDTKLLNFEILKKSLTPLYTLSKILSKLVVARE